MAVLLDLCMNFIYSKTIKYTEINTKVFVSEICVLSFIGL